MQNRLVVWGSDERNEQVLVAIDLNLESFKVNVFAFHKKRIDREFSKAMEEKWAKGATVQFPEHFQEFERQLSEDSLLPDLIKVDKPGLIRRTQNEWAYYLLTSKLWESHLSELSDLKERSNSLENYDKTLFEDCKSFWTRLIENRKEQDLSQERLDEIKEQLDQIFDKLKKLRQTESKDFSASSEKEMKALIEKTSNVKSKIEAGEDAQECIAELKNLRGEMKYKKLTKEHWKILDDAINDCFSVLTEKRKSSKQNYLDGRIEGLRKVISKMESSLEKDRKDLDYNSRRAGHVKTNQLEMQLRQVKIKTIQDKLESKEEKLKDIQKTLSELLKQKDRG